MFSNAKTIARTTAVAKPAAAKPAKPTSAIVGWEQLAALDATSKALASLVALRKEAMERDVLRPEFIARGLAVQGKPVAMNPVEGDGKGSAYLAKTSTRTVLSDEEVTLIADTSGVAIDANGNVPGFTKKLEKQPAYLTINPDYMPGGELYDEAKMRRIERLLEREVPDFIVQVEPDAQTVVDDEALNSMFKLEQDAVETLFSLLCTIATRPVFGGPLDKAWEVIKPLIPEAVQALANSKATKATKRAPGGPSLTEQLRASLDATE